MSRKGGFSSRKKSHLTGLLSGDPVRVSEDRSQGREVRTS